MWIGLQIDHSWAQSYRSANVVHPKGGYWKPITITTPIIDHKDGQYVKAKHGNS